MTTRRLLTLTLSAALAAFGYWALSDADRASADLPVGAELASIGALEFGADGTLFAGDSAGAAVYAFALAEKPVNALPELAVEDLDEKVAALLGGSPRDIRIKDMAVHPATGAAYLSIMRGQGEEQRPALVMVGTDGEVANLELGGMPHSRLPLGDAPAAQPEARRDPRTLTITDLEMIDGELFIAGLSNEEFASVLRRAPFPFADSTEATGLEIYHGAHGKYETHAPIYAFMPFEIDGSTHLLAGYLCTPLVTFPLEEVRGAERLRGKTIAELGWGNVPLDILSFERDGEEYVLMTNSRRGTMVMKAADIRAAQARDGITSEAEPRTGVDYLGAPLGHVVQVADYDKDNILVLARDPENGSLALRTRAKRWL
jgi:hypothetical protein